MQISIMVVWPAGSGDYARHLVDILTMVNKWISCIQAPCVLSAGLCSNLINTAYGVLFRPSVYLLCR